MTRIICDMCGVDIDVRCASKLIIKNVTASLDSSSEECKRDLCHECLDELKRSLDDIHKRRVNLRKVN